jgi:hypothetical protein
MKRYSQIISVFGFFVLAGVGCLSDVPSLTCATRALIGAVCLFLMANVAGKVIVSILVDAIVRSQSGGQDRPRGGSL